MNYSNLEPGMITITRLKHDSQVYSNTTILYIGCYETMIHDERYIEQAFWCTITYETKILNSELKSESFFGTSGEYADFESSIPAHIKVFNQFGERIK